MIPLLKKSDLFHVHTFRCRHAQQISDEAYVKQAIELGATGIFFSDHAPFPGNPFGNRMDIEELPEYLNTIHALKERYIGKIEIRCGLETEYFPSFRGYYEELRGNPLLDFMMIGQHMYEICPGKYSFQLTEEEKNEREHIGCGEAIMQGSESGLFDVIAHPDRIFRNKTDWTGDMTELSKRLIGTVCSHHLKLEKNLESMRSRQNYREEFWALVPNNADIVTGTDAHSIKDLVEKWDICRSQRFSPHSHRLSCRIL